jgi:hypothetical protein
VVLEAPSAAPRMYAFLSFSHLTIFAGGGCVGWTV